MKVTKYLLQPGPTVPRRAAALRHLLSPQSPDQTVNDRIQAVVLGHYTLTNFLFRASPLPGRLRAESAGELLLGPETELPLTRLPPQPSLLNFGESDLAESEVWAGSSTGCLLFLLGKTFCLNCD